SIIVIFLVLLILIIPSSMLVSMLVKQTGTAVTGLMNYEINHDSLPLLSEEKISTLQNNIDAGLATLRDTIINAAPNLVGSIANIILHLFIFFFIMYFALINGPEWYRKFLKDLPLDKEVKKRFFGDLEITSKGILYGQFLTAVIQGSIGGIVFFIFGIPNAIFWGFIMILFSFIPLLGTPIVFVPAGILQLLQGNYIGGLGVLIIGFTLIMNIDNLIRPILVRKFAPVHPILVIVGVFGGLAAWGFAGVILGPLVLALLFTLVRDLNMHKDLWK
ncbi:AI-2E family transporter, partial [Candidatus Woesearchaeota archaeon]|nr:AI-2E family transporter [Candidatus Woesearchaeota archaeon]